MKTIIGVLAAHDSWEPNERLHDTFEELWKHPKRDRLDNYHFVFSGGTFSRLVLGTTPIKRPSGKTVSPLSNRVTRDLLRQCTVLPSFAQGGVILLANLIVQRKCSIIWPFFTPQSNHLFHPVNLALLRLCDVWHVKRLMNTGSVMEWFERESDQDSNRNLQEVNPMSFDLADRTPILSQVESINGRANGRRYPAILVPRTEFPKFDELAPIRIAMIAHDHMKDRMVEFAVDYEQHLIKFDKILATGTTGGQIVEACPKLKELNKVLRVRSGPKGGDIEISTEILFGRCHVVFFFVDPFVPHPHIDDIRVVFGACMIHDKVRMLANEMQAREWMEHVAKTPQGLLTRPAAPAATKRVRSK